MYLFCIYLNWVWISLKSKSPKWCPVLMHRCLLYSHQNHQCRYTYTCPPSKKNPFSSLEGSTLFGWHWMSGHYILFISWTLNLPNYVLSWCTGVGKIHEFQNPHHQRKSLFLLGRLHTLWFALNLDLVWTSLKSKSPKWCPVLMHRCVRKGN